MSRGLFRPTDAGDPYVASLRAWQLALPPDAAFSGPTAARLLGWDLPPLLGDLPVFASMRQGQTAPFRPGLCVTRHRTGPVYDELDGLRVARPCEVIVACARFLSVLDLVVIIDSALRSRQVELLELWIASTRLRRGTPQLRRALLLADGGAGSVMETLLRVLHVVGGHDVVTQHVVVDEEGQFVARGDLWIWGTRQLQEYEGADHLTPAQFQIDRRRDRRLARADYRRNAYTAGDVFHRAVGILADADRAVGREPDPRRARAWHRMLSESSFTPSGRAGLRERVAGLAGPRVA